MGSPAMNLDPRLDWRRRAMRCRVVLDRGPSASRSRLPLNGAASVHDPRTRARRWVFGARPQALTIPTAPTAMRPTLPPPYCHIEVVEPAGSDTFAVTNLGGKGVVARLRADANVQPGPVDAALLQSDQAVFFDPATENRIR